MTVDAELRKSFDSLALFSDLVRSQMESNGVEFERLLDGYLEARRGLAKQFSMVAQHYLLHGESILEKTRKEIERKMAALFGGQIPEKYFRVRGYKSVQPILLQYLAQHVGNPVRSSKLRILTSDQTHTERRVRDLRDLGFHVDWKKVSDEDQYVLKSLEPDLDAAATLQVRKNVKEDKKLAKGEKEALLASLRHNA